jgi:hypothetical protein
MESQAMSDLKVIKVFRLPNRNPESLVKMLGMEMKEFLVFRVAMDLRAGQEIGDHLGLPVLRVKRVTRVNRDTGKNNY